MQLPSLVARHLDAIASLCDEYGVRRLDVFGSVTTPAFDAQRSDVDFLVEFLPETELGPWMKRYFELRDLLSSLLQRDVDLTLSESITNPWLRKSIEQTRRMVYASQVPQAA